MEIFIEEALNRILSYTGNTLLEELPIRRKLTFYSIYKGLIISDTLKDAALSLNLTTDIIEKITSRTLYPLHSDKPKSVKWGSWLLSLIGYKKCRECKRILDRASQFHRSSETWDSFGYVCKDCKAIHREIFTIDNPNYSKEHYLANKSEYIARAVQYKTKRMLATPPWANLDDIKHIYDTCPIGYHVDHIIPLQGELVSGLHVETNLRHLPAIDNMKKHNKFTAE